MPRLTIDIEARLAGFQDSLTKIERAATNTAGRIEGAFSGLGRGLVSLGGGLAVGAIAAFTKAGVDMVAMLDDMAEQTSLSVEFLDQLQQLARTGGHDFNSIADAASKLARNMGEAQAGSKQQVEAFKALGIALRDSEGRLRSTDEVLVEFAQKFSAAENKTVALAYAVQLLGKSGAQAAPFLNDLARDGLKLSRVTADQAESAERAQKAFNELGNAVDSLKIAFGNLVASPVGRWLTELARNIANIQTLFREGLAGKVNAWDLDAPFARIGEINKRLEELAANREKVMSSGMSGTRKRGLVETLDKEIAKLTEERSLLQDRASKLMKGLPPLEEPIGSITLDPKGLSDSADKTRAALEKARRDAEKLRQEDIDGWVKYVEELERVWRIEADAEVKAVDDAFQEMKKLRDDDIRGWVEYAQAVMDAAEAADKALAEIEIENQKKQIDDAKEAAKDMGIAITGAFADAIVEAKSLSEVLKGLAKDVLRVLMQRLVISKIAGGLTGILEGVFGGMASGGSVSAGSPYLVGERGPELFVPDRHGNIIPNDQLGSVGGSGVTVNVNVSTGVAATVRSEIAQMLPAIQRAAVAGVSDARQRGQRI